MPQVLKGEFQNVTTLSGYKVYSMSDEVELDEVFFPIRLPEEVRGEKIKRGAGSQPFSYRHVLPMARVRNYKE